MPSTRATNLTQDLLSVFGAVAQVKQTAVTANKEVFRQLASSKEVELGKLRRISSLEATEFTSSEQFRNEASKFEESYDLSRDSFPDVDDATYDAALERLSGIQNAHKTSLVNSQMMLQKQEISAGIIEGIKNSGVNQNYSTVHAAALNKNLTLAQRKRFLDMVGIETGKAVTNNLLENSSRIQATVVHNGVPDKQEYVDYLNTVTMAHNDIFKYELDDNNDIHVEYKSGVDYDDVTPSAGGEQSNVAKFGEDDKRPVLAAALRGWKSLSVSTGQDDYMRLKAIAGLNRTSENTLLNGSLVVNQSTQEYERYLTNGINSEAWSGSKLLSAQVAVQNIKETKRVYGYIVDSYKGNAGFSEILDSKLNIKINDITKDITETQIKSILEESVTKDYDSMDLSGNYQSAMARIVDMAENNVLPPQLSSTLKMFSKDGGAATSVSDLKKTIAYLDVAGSQNPNVLLDLNMNKHDTAMIQKKITEWESNDKRVSESVFLNQIASMRKVSIGKIASTNVIIDKLANETAMSDIAGVLKETGYWWNFFNTDLQFTDNQENVASVRNSLATKLTNMNLTSTTDFNDFKNSSVDGSKIQGNGRTVDENRASVRNSFSTDSDNIEPKLSSAAETIDSDILSTLEDAMPYIVKHFLSDVEAIDNSLVKIVTTIVPIDLRPDAASETVTTILYDGVTVGQMKASDIQNFGKDKSFMSGWSYTQDDNGFIMLKDKNTEAQRKAIRKANIDFQTRMLK